MTRRDQIDQIAWMSIHNTQPIPLDRARGSRPVDYLELERLLWHGVSFEFGWSQYLHAFFAVRTASFFAYPSPPSLSPGWQAILAGSAEWLSAEFNLPHPEWTNESKYFLDTPWDPVEDLGLDMSEFIVDKLARSPEAFRKRNIAFLSRNLITL